MDEPRLTKQTIQVLHPLMLKSGQELSGSELSKLSKLPSGTLYPILHRLEGAGWLDSRWEDGDPVTMKRPRRRYYRITALGVRQLRSVVDTLMPGLEAAWAR